MQNHLPLRKKMPKVSHLNSFLDFDIWAFLKGEMFVYKHTETIEYVKKKATFSQKIQTSSVNKLRIMLIRNAKFLEFYFNPIQNRGR